MKDILKATILKYSIILLIIKTCIIIIINYYIINQESTYKTSELFKS